LGTVDPYRDPYRGAQWCAFARFRARVAYSSVLFRIRRIAGSKPVSRFPFSQRNCHLGTPSLGPTATGLVMAPQGDSPLMNEISPAETKKADANQSHESEAH
jgi:hypothetical protein